MTPAHPEPRDVAPAPEATSTPGRPISVLLAGFEPFAGADRNESWDAVLLVHESLAGDPGIATAVHRLPVEFGRAADLLLDTVRAARPDVVIALGLAAGRRAVTPERVAINVQDAGIPDNRGDSPCDEPCVPHAPAAWFSTLPIKAMTAAARTLGIPADVSQTAGTFVCNDVFFRLQHALATEPALAHTRGGFIHVPAAADLPLERTAAALTAMVRTAATRPDDDRIPAGREH